MISKYFSVLLLMMMISIVTQAQFETSGESGSSSTYTPPKNTKPPSEPIKDRIVVGGGLNLSFGTYTYIGLTPLIGYRATDKLIVGSIFTYQYTKDTRPGYNYSTSFYGVTPFARYSIFSGLFAHAEYEMLYGEYYYNDDPRWINSLLIGGGYGYPIGNNGFIGIYILWNVTPDSNPLYHIYERPVLRMSFGIGL